MWRPFLLHTILQVWPDVCLLIMANHSQQLRFIIRSTLYICRYEKEKRDYTYCLRQAAHGVQFVLIVEDDALPMNDCLSVIARLVTSHRTGRPDSHTAGQRFYVKLYHPVHLKGYDTSYSFHNSMFYLLIFAPYGLRCCTYLVSWPSVVRID